MNDTGGGVTAIHDVPGDITRIGFHWMLLFPFCHSKGASICSSHGESRKVTGVLCPEFSNFRIVSSHGMSRNNLFYHELSNYRISFTRNVAEITDFLCPEFANLRIFFFTRIVAEKSFLSRIIELSNIFHTECRGGHELSNYRIFFTRSVAEGHELSNYRISFTRRVAEVTNYRIIELFLHT